MDATALLLLLIVAMIAVALTALLCRHMLARGRRLGWWLAGLGVIVATVGSLLLAVGPDIFTTRFWTSGQKAPVLVQLLYLGGFCVLAAGLPAVATVWYYRATRMRATFRCLKCGDEVADSMPIECPGCSGTEFVRLSMPDEVMITDYGDYQVIGLFVPSHRSRKEHDRSMQELDNILTPVGIEYGLNGSRVYQLIVSKAKAKAARELLRGARFKIGEVRLY